MTSNISMQDLNYLDKVCTDLDQKINEIQKSESKKGSVVRDPKEIVKTLFLYVKETKRKDGKIEQKYEFIEKSKLPLMNRIRLKLFSGYDLLKSLGPIADRFENLRNSMAANSEMTQASISVDKEFDKKITHIESHREYLLDMLGHSIGVINKNPEKQERVEKLEELELKLTGSIKQKITPLNSPKSSFTQSPQSLETQYSPVKAAKKQAV